MNYSIYKLNADFNGLKSGDDLIALGAPYYDSTGTLAVQGEVYGSGYTGQIMSVPASMLAVVASCVDSNKIECFMNYSNIPTPESNPNFGQTTSNVATQNTVSKSKVGSSSIGIALLLVCAAGLVIFAIKTSKTE